MEVSKVVAVELADWAPVMAGEGEREGQALE